VSTRSELRGSRELLVNLTMREVRGKYKRTVLGQGWSLLNPVVSIAIFSLVFGFLLKADPPPGNPSGLDAFGLWLAAGLLPWTFFSGAVLAGMSSLIINANLVKKVYFRREVLVASTVLSFVVTFVIELLVLSGLLLIWGGRPLLWLPAVALAVALLAVFALGLALLLAIANVYFRDTGHLTALVFQLWFYLTPVVYPSTLVDDAVAARGGVSIGGWELPVAHLYQLNPMERFVAVFRALLYDNRWPTWQDWAGALIAAVVAIVLGALVFPRFSRRLAEEL
jgi:ABC-2 type transport system permease protein